MHSFHYQSSFSVNRNSTRKQYGFQHQQQHTKILKQFVCFAKPDALLFDCDGVLVDTECEGHRVSFNKTFDQKGIPHQWSKEVYGVCLETAGGKERMLKYFTENEDTEPFKSITDLEERKAYVAELHKIKTQLFKDMINSGELPPREGVKRIILSAIEAQVPVAVCSTSNEEAVRAVVYKLGLPTNVADGIRIFAGDMVPRKKPDPAIYLLAADELKLEPSKCWVVEDSRIGLLAAKAAGMKCVVTPSTYTHEEDFSEADRILVKGLGDGTADDL